MKALIVVLALSAAAACSPASAYYHHRHRTRLVRVPVVTPVVTADPFWRPDYYIVPRYRYRPQDDRVDTSPNAPPVAPSDDTGITSIGQ